MDREALATRLASARPGMRLPHIGDRTPGWSPDRGRCHENAARWVEADPTFQVVHGCLNATGETFENRVRFHSHSVVRAPTGELVDVTLNRDDPSYAFIPHPFDDTHFREQVIGKIPTIDHILGPDPEILHEWNSENPELDNRQF
nr:hypothetical protein [uncultured Brevundimonas sp.]